MAAASVVVMVSIQPGADAALSPYALPPDGLHQAIFSPYGDQMAGAFEPRDSALGTLPSLFHTEPQVAMITPEPARPVDVPAPPATPVVAQPEIAPKPLMPMGTLDQAQPVAPEVAVQEHIVTPPETAPRVEPRESLVVPREPVLRPAPRGIPSRRNAVRTRRNADILAIKFDGPAGAPFAHTRFCIKYPGECRVHKMKFRGGPIELTAARHQELVRVNADVNRSIVATRMNEPVAQEQWVISPKAGDCNDYAVTKRHELIARGWPARALLLAEVVTTWGEHHLVLVVRTLKGDLVADSLEPKILNWTKTPYEWVRVESPVNPMFWAKIKAPSDVVAMNKTNSKL
jgi:predicted transglutaminase-like cysteine proteinase